MKKRSIALLLALVMCLSLFSACGGKDSTPDTKDPPASSANTPAPAAQPDEQKTPEDPASETPEPEPEPEPENTAGAEFLALLQEEWNNGFVQGQGPRHTYYKTWSPFIYNGAVLMHYDNSYYSYDIATKEFKEIFPVARTMTTPAFLNGKFYFSNSTNREAEYGAVVYDSNGERLDFWQGYTSLKVFEGGIVATILDPDTGEGLPTLFSYDGEKIADLPIPQREAEHGLTEDVHWQDSLGFAADGTLYATDWYMYWRLNMDTLAWENMGTFPEVTRVSQVDSSLFCGKYIPGKDGIYDSVTGEQVFEYGELYPAVWGLCYFGGDQYLGKYGSEYRWVNLTDLSMSDPLPFPEGKNVTILDDTYCIYQDDYGWFLWNYNTGTEETIMLYNG